MRKLMLGLLTITVFLTPIVNANAAFKPGHPDEYTVVKGDTLWGISSRFLKSPWKWPEIWHVNPQVKNPHLIYPGDKIGMIYVDGQPMLTLKGRGAESRTVKLRPAMRVSMTDGAVPTIPLKALKGFLNGNRMVGPTAFDRAPYIISGDEGRLLSGAHDHVYALGEFWSEAIDGYGIYRKGELYRDPFTKEVLGLEAREVGRGKLVLADDSVRKVMIHRSVEEVRIGDSMMPLEGEDIALQFMPSSPDSDLSGHIIAVANGLTQIGLYDVVIVNVGDRDQVVPGNVFAIYKQGGYVKDPKTQRRVELPAEQAGLMMVFRVFEKLSYAIVLDADKPLSVMDKVITP